MISSPILAVVLGVLIAVIFGGSVAALLLSKFRKAQSTEMSQICIAAKAGTLEAEAVVDQKMGELQEAHEQSLRGMRLDVMAELAKPMIRKQETPLDARVEELKRMAKK